MAHCGWEKKLRSLGWEPRAVDDSPCSPGADLPEYSRKPSDLWYSFGYFARWQEFHRSKFCFRGTFNFSTPHPPSQSSDVCHKHWMRLLFKVIWRIQFRLDFFLPQESWGRVHIFNKLQVNFDEVCLLLFFLKLGPHIVDLLDFRCCCWKHVSHLFALYLPNISYTVKRYSGCSRSRNSVTYLFWFFFLGCFKVMSDVFKWASPWCNLHDGLDVSITGHRHQVTYIWLKD